MQIRTDYPVLLLLTLLNWALLKYSLKFVQLTAPKQEPKGIKYSHRVEIKVSVIAGAEER